MSIFHNLNGAVPLFGLAGLVALVVVIWALANYYESD